MARAPGGTRNLDSLNHFLRNIEDYANRYGSAKIPGTLKVKEMPADPSEFFTEKSMKRWAEHFVATVFVPQVLKPAYEHGTGLNGEGNGGTSNLYGHTPIIEQGVGIGRLHDPEYNFDWEKGQGSIRISKDMRRMAREQEQDQLERQRAQAGKQYAEYLTSRHKANWKRGFEDLFKNLTKVGVLSDKKGVGIGPATLVLSQKLHSYSVVRAKASGRTRYNSFFYAAEYGTGIAENVGGDQWVNRDPETKEDDGRWYFTDALGRGARFRGQGGLHFLFESRSRQPRELYYDKMAELLPTYLDKYLNKVTKGAVRWIS